MALRSVWTRICQFGCPCPSCNSRSALNTRGKTAYQATQSRPFSSSTLAYTVAFGYATAIDGERKIRRKEQWEEAIAKQKAEIEKLEQAMNLKKQRILKARLGSLKEEVGQNWEVETPFDPAKAEAEAKLAADEREKFSGDRLRLFNEFPVGDSEVSEVPLIPTLNPLDPHHLPPQSIWSTRKVRFMGTREAWTAKKTYGVELCITRMVLELCLASGLSDIREEDLEDIPTAIRPYAVLSKDEAENIARQIELELTRLLLLRREGIPDKKRLSVPMPKYDIGLVPNKLTLKPALSLELKNICESTTGGDSTTIAKICEQVINSPCSPDLATVNCLLVAFNRWGRPDLSKAVVSVVYDGRLRPNEITCSSILRYYRQTNDQTRFLEYFNLMGGGRNGLMLARPWFKTISNIKSPRLVPSGSKLIQAVTPSALVYLEVVMGLAQYIGLEKTWTFCKHLASYGWSFDHSIMYLLLFRGAVESARDICQEIWSQAQQLADAGHRVPQTLYALMIAIHRCNQEEDQAWRVLEEFINNYPDVGFKQKRRLVRQRVVLVQQTRIAEDRVKESEYSRLEEDHKIWLNAALKNT